MAFLIGKYDMHGNDFELLAEGGVSEKKLHVGPPFGDGVRRSKRMETGANKRPGC